MNLKNGSEVVGLQTTLAEDSADTLGTCTRPPMFGRQHWDPESASRGSVSDLTPTTHVNSMCRNGRGALDPAHPHTK